MTKPVTQDDPGPRRVPALQAYLTPFRVVEKDADAVPWSATIEQINKYGWDYAALHEIIGGINIGLEYPHCLLVCRDGGLVLPPLPDLLSDQSAIEYFNRLLAGLLIGGVYCEALTPDGLELASILDWNYVRSVREGRAATNVFHSHIRLRAASSLEAIALYQPRCVRLPDLQKAMSLGLAALGKLAPMQGEFLLRGVTAYARRDWGHALANLWIVTEQLLEALWERHVLSPLPQDAVGKRRRAQLTDTRTWTAATKVELLHQKGIVSISAFIDLSEARKARNELSHKGTHPNNENAKSAYSSVVDLMRTVLDGQEVPLFAMDLGDHALSDPFAPTPPIVGQPQFWRAIPKLPGEEEIEKEYPPLAGKAV